MKYETTEKKETKRAAGKTAAYFFMGVLLSTCISLSSVAVILPQLGAATKEQTQKETEVFAAVTSELITDTVKNSMGEYLSERETARILTEQEITAISHYITKGVSSQTSVTDRKLKELKSLIRTGVDEVVTVVNENSTKAAEALAVSAAEWNDQITKTNEKMDAAGEKLSETAASGDQEISENLRAYIDQKVVPAVTASIEMNRKDIAAVNKKLRALGNEYDAYTKATNASLKEIETMFASFQEGTTENFTDVTNEFTLLCERYESYAAATDSGIHEIEKSLDERLTIAAFEAFRETYETYKTQMSGTLDAVNEMTAGLEESKADKEMVADLTDRFHTLQTTYENFAGDSGAFASLTERVTSTESMLAGSNDEIAALKEQVAQLESSLTDTLKEQAAELKSGLTDAQNQITTLDQGLANVWNDIYPVGAVYLSFTGENPAVLFGGTWEPVQNRMLMSAGSAYPAGSTGGNSSVTLSAGNIPTLSMSGATAAKNSIGTTAGGAYNGTITSNGNFSGGTYGTSNAGTHSHTLGNYGGHTDIWSGEGGRLYGYALYDAGSFTTDASGDHGHTVSIPNQTITSLGSLAIGNHSHTVNIPALSVTGAYTNNAQQSLNVLNPYVSVYMWKRTA